MSLRKFKPVRANNIKLEVMKPKKTKKADLSNKRSLFLEIGFCVSLAAMITVFTSSRGEVTVAVGDPIVVPYVPEQSNIAILDDFDKPVTAPRAQLPSNLGTIVRIKPDTEIDPVMVFPDFDPMAIYGPVAIPGTSDGDGNIGSRNVELEPPVIYKAEVMPKFQGSDAKTAFQLWVQNSLVYPEVALSNDITGTVIVKFVVGADGEVRNVEIFKSANRYLDEEAMRVVESSPKWTPGMQQGMPVAVTMTIPVIFKFVK